MGYFDEAIENKENEEVLEHHGIRGQKWGVRRFQNKDGSLKPAGEKRYGDARSLKVAGHKALAKVYEINEKTYAKSNKTLSSMNKAAKNNQLKKAEEAQKEANKKRDERVAYKEEFNKNLKEVKEKATFKDKIIFSDGTRRRAAKLMTDNKNMSYEEATKQSHKEAVINTAGILAAYGSYHLVNEFMKNK